MRTLVYSTSNLLTQQYISKRFSACSARIGCVSSKNKDIIKNIMKLCQGRLCVATIEQIGTAALADVSHKYIKDVVVEYEKRRNIVHGALSKIEGVVCEKPRGAFYIMAKLPVANAEDFATWLLTDYE